MNFIVMLSVNFANGTLCKNKINLSLKLIIDDGAQTFVNQRMRIDSKHFGITFSKSVKP